MRTEKGRGEDGAEGQEEGEEGGKVDDEGDGRKGPLRRSESDGGSSALKEKKDLNMGEEKARSSVNDLESIEAIESNVVAMHALGIVMLSRYAELVETVPELQGWKVDRARELLGFLDRKLA